jgi:hypothetical protein
MSGRLLVLYNLGTEPHRVYDADASPLNDGRPHAVRVHRIEANASMWVDYKLVVEYRAKGECLSTLICGH